MLRTAISAVVVASICAALTAGCQKSSCPAGGTRTTVERSAVLQAASVEKVIVVAGAGTLRVSGGSNDVHGEGQVCAPDKHTADRIELLSYLKGKDAYVEARFPFTLDGARSIMNLEVDMPSRLPVLVVNKSGNSTIEKVAGVSIADLGGNLRISHILGPVTITRSAGGDVLIRDVQGTAAVQRDLGGTLTIERVSGNVVLQHTETASIVIRDVDGDVVIWDDGPGDIDVEDVAGDLFVQSDRGGKLKYSEIAGTVHLPESGGF